LSSGTDGLLSAAIPAKVRKCAEGDGVNSQNRMNAGAEYVLYRIWATLQSREGLHAESLLTCLGALAGYACQAYVRRAGGRAELPLTASPLSVWALVRRSVQKLNEPLPDIDEISAHVTATMGTNEFGVLRVADEHRPNKLPIVYLMQLWPQILPIAQRFCRRPAQLPVLFGIALQRAIEHTTDRLNPTLAASIAMESAVAMSKATLPSALSDLFQAPPASSNITVTSKSTASAPPLPEVRATRKKRTPGIDARTFEAGFFSTRMRSAKVVATVMSIAIIAVASAAWKNERRADTPAIARATTGLSAAAFRPATANRFGVPSSFEAPAQFEQPVQQAQVDNGAAPSQEMPPAQETLQPSTSDEELPAPAPDQGEGIIIEDWQQSA
jgi:hypothetical protein